MVDGQQRVPGNDWIYEKLVTSLKDKSNTWFGSIEFQKPLVFVRQPLCFFFYSFG
jgi:hypothetical protein